MIYEIKINIEEIIDLKSQDEQINLMKHILWSTLDNSSHDKFLDYILNDKLEAEMEFDKRPEVIQALKTLRKALKEK